MELNELREEIVKLKEKKLAMAKAKPGKIDSAISGDEEDSDF